MAATKRNHFIKIESFRAGKRIHLILNLFQRMNASMILVALCFLGRAHDRTRTNTLKKTPTSLTFHPETDQKSFRSVRAGLALPTDDMHCPETIHAISTTWYFRCQFIIVTNRTANGTVLPRVVPWLAWKKHISRICRSDPGIKGQQSRLAVRSSTLCR